MAKNLVDSCASTYPVLTFNFRLDPSAAGVVISGNDYVFEVTCQDGGSWPSSSSIAWQNCIVEECVVASIPDLAAKNFTVVDSKDVKVGEKLQYECVDNSQVRELHCSVILKTIENQISVTMPVEKDHFDFLSAIIFQSQVIDLGKYLELECDIDGKFIEPIQAEWQDGTRKCRAPGMCLQPVPQPLPSVTYLQVIIVLLTRC